MLGKRYTAFKSHFANLEISIDEIHVWYVSLNSFASQSQLLLEVLSQTERVRAGRFHLETDRTSFIISHGLLRTILSFYLDIEPVRISFSYGKNGKPVLANHSTKLVHFNMSRSHGMILYGFARDFEIGVDIERIRNIPEMDRIAARFFSEKEQVAFQGLPESKKEEGFFNCWTRKEAFIKAIGEGLSFPLNSFDVTLNPGEKARIMSIEGDAKIASQWFVQELKPALGYTAAVVVQGQNWRICLFQC